MSDIKLGPIQFVQNQPEQSEILLVTMRCLQMALERRHDDMAKTLCMVVGRILNPCLMYQGAPIVSDASAGDAYDMSGGIGKPNDWWDAGKGGMK
jgi:hypothetical protein